MRPALDIVMKWQLQNPDITDPTAAIEEVRNSGVLKNKPQLKTKSPQEPPKQGELTSTLISHFLRHELKPIFVQTSRKADITPIGRRKVGEPPIRSFQDEGPLLDDGKAKPWKYDSSWAIELLVWICKKLDSTTVEREWGFLLPPILTLLEDTDTSIRAQGCELLQLLLEATPPALLQRTGLAPLFEETLTISLSYLPTLTPVEESAIILPAAFSAMLTLIDTTKPSPMTHQSPSSARLKSLDILLRRSILAHYPHIQEYPRIVIIYLTHLPSILSRMGIDSVKHLKDLLPLLSAILSDPLAIAYPELPLNAVIALQSVIANAWPRISAWDGEVLKGVVVCWVRCAEKLEARMSGDGSELEKVKRELKICIEMLRAVMVNNGEEKEFKVSERRFVDAEPLLQELFGD